jgi:anti-sigma28 factor (negative regulator of flagellin synthesis)
MKISNNPIINSNIKVSTQQTKKIDTEKTRVEEIKEAIKNGTYKIDINKTAKAMAKALL